MTILVLRPETGWRKVWATISYGWESAEFYRKWGPHQDPSDLQGPTIDPLNAQSEYSSALLEMFRSILQSPDYVARLKRHYQMFRAAVDQTSHPSARYDLNRLQNRRLKLRDPKRRRRR